VRGHGTCFFQTWPWESLRAKFGGPGGLGHRLGVGGHCSKVTSRCSRGCRNYGGTREPANGRPTGSYRKLRRGQSNPGNDSESHQKLFRVWPDPNSAARACSAADYAGYWPAALMLLFERLKFMWDGRRKQFLRTWRNSPPGGPGPRDGRRGGLSRTCAQRPRVSKPVVMMLNRPDMTPPPRSQYDNLNSVGPAHRSLLEVVTDMLRF